MKPVIVVRRLRSLGLCYLLIVSLLSFGLANPSPKGIEVVELVVDVVVSIVVVGKKIGVAINSIEGEAASNLLLSLLCD